MLWNGAISNYLAPNKRRFLISSQLFINEETEVETVELTSDLGSLEGVMDGVHSVHVELKNQKRESGKDRLVKKGQLV
jgi:hypothetical protein